VEQPQSLQEVNLSPSVDQLIEQWPEQQRELVNVLRSIILDASPAIIESVKFNIPFYTLNGLLLYISPNKKGGLLLAFCLGRHMTDAQQVFVGHDRKEVRHIPIVSLNGELLETIRQYVLETVELNGHKRSFSKALK